MIEIQSLVSTCSLQELAAPGYNKHFNMILVLEKKSWFPFRSKDVFLNIGGIRGANYRFGS
jgi:predicted ATP-dependent serine protease